MELLFSFLLSFIVVLFLCPWCIPFLRRLKAGQSIREEGPQSHQAKQGTPTMGGLMIIIAVTLGVLYWTVRYFEHKQFLAVLWVIWLMFAGHGLLGFWDDYIKVKLKRNLGLKAWQKLAGQTVLSIALTVAADLLGRGTLVSIPLTTWSFDLGPIGFAIFVFIVLVGASNAVNLTDGLDGLAAGTMFFASFSFAAICTLGWMMPQAIFALLMAGACVGFLWFNRHPAQVFMGDTGSLALGGGLAAVAVLSSQEMLLVLVGGVFVAEALSVIIQVLYFKKTGGKRFFRMSPLHHHFELGGWPEKKVVLMFWFAGAVLGFLGFWITQLGQSHTF